MLKVEDRFMIKELHHKGLSISDIARLTGHDRKTVRAVIQGPLLRQRRPPAPRASKLDPYTPYLQQRLADGVFNAQKLFHEIQAQGYRGQRSLVRTFVQPFRQARAAQATIRFETPPGEQAQVDWGHFGTIEHRGRTRRLYAFLFTLGWSRALYLEFTVSLTSAVFLRCHVHAFAALGGYVGDACQEASCCSRANRRWKIFWRPTWPLAMASSSWLRKVGVNSLVVTKKEHDSQIVSKWQSSSTGRAQ